MTKHPAKKRLCISLDVELLKWLEKNVENLRFASVSHGINYCIKEEKDRSQKMSEYSAVVPSGICYQDTCYGCDYLKLVYDENGFIVKTECLKPKTVVVFSATANT